MATKRDSGIKTVCRNKKAGYNYYLTESMEAGIVLLGAEVKSLREGRASLVDSYAKVNGGRFFSTIPISLPIPLRIILNWTP